MEAAYTLSSFLNFLFYFPFFFSKAPLSVAQVSPKFTVTSPQPLNTSRFSLCSPGWPDTHNTLASVPSAGIMGMYRHASLDTISWATLVLQKVQKAYLLPSHRVSPVVDILH